MKMGEAMDKPKRVDRAEKGTGTRSHPYLYLSLGFGFLAATVMVVATAGVLAAGIGFVIPAVIFLGLGVNGLQQRRHAFPRPASRERELLSAIRDNGGSITPAEAAMAITLTVEEADRMLSELAAGGHLRVDVEGGMLSYALPARSNRELGG